MRRSPASCWTWRILTRVPRSRLSWTAGVASSRDRRHSMVCSFVCCFYAGVFTAVSLLSQTLWLPERACASMARFTRLRSRPLRVCFCGVAFVLLSLFFFPGFRWCCRHCLTFPCALLMSLLSRAAAVQTSRGQEPRGAARASGKTQERVRPSRQLCMFSAAHPALPCFLSHRGVACEFVDVARIRRVVCPVGPHDAPDVVRLLLGRHGTDRLLCLVRHGHPRILFLSRYAPGLHLRGAFGPHVNAAPAQRVRSARARPSTVRSSLFSQVSARTARLILPSAGTSRCATR